MTGGAEVRLDVLWDYDVLMKIMMVQVMVGFVRALMKIECSPLSSDHNHTLNRLSKWQLINLQRTILLFSVNDGQQLKRRQHDTLSEYRHSPHQSDSQKS